MGDFKGGGAPPHVAYIYTVLVGMSARAWLDEYERVIVRGEATSLALGTAVSMTFRFMLVAAHATAAAAVSAGEGDMVIWAFYVGKEQRGRASKALYVRVF